MDEHRQQLSPAEKFLERAQQWIAPPGLQFANAEIEQAYRRRVQMLIDAIQLRRPERVPVHIGAAGFYPFVYANVLHRDAMYNYATVGRVMRKFWEDFMPDTMSSAAAYGPGTTFDILDYKLYRWPGHEMPDNQSFQYVEGEYMRDDEYDALIQDPTDFFLHKYLPRIFGALAPWDKLPKFTDILELPVTGGCIVPFGIAALQESYKKLMAAGQVAAEWVQACAAIDSDVQATLGLCRFAGGFSKAPFDIIGDTLRGTRGVILDKFRRPKKLLAAMERLVPIAIEMGVRGATARKVPVVSIPLHKGADGFMSNADFKTFYWPTLKAVLLGLVHEGVVPYLFVEGSYNQRLDLVLDRDIPAGTTVWVFDQSEMKEVKKRFNGWSCFGGNVPASLLETGTPGAVSDYVKQLLDEVAQDGGFILAPGAVLDRARPENLQAMIETGKSYGI